MVDGEIYSQPELYEYGSTVIPVPEPLRRGSSFSGWDRPFNFKMPAENIVIEGTFKVNDYNYKIQYYYGNILDESQSITDQAEYGTTVAAPAPETVVYEGRGYKLPDGGVYEIQVSDEPEENVINVTYEAASASTAASSPAGPASPSAPASDNGAVTPAGVIQTIFEPVTALAEKVADRGEGYQKTVQSADEDVPLANGETPPVQSQCILHFLILLAAFAIELFYIRNRKREQLRYYAGQGMSAKAEQDD